MSSYVGTIVGESTSREFRLAVAHDSVREQDIIAVDAELGDADNAEAKSLVRVWAKVQAIERLNPLFPAEAGHELAATHTDPFDTVLSLSREMVTAVCQVLGFEETEGAAAGKLDHLRYPPRPASTAYRPELQDISRIVLGELQEKQHRALDIATLSNRADVAVNVDGHMAVTRHLAILAMTGAGKSWAARRIIEQLARKNYPIVIFDPHGDYTGLGDIPGLSGKVRRYYAQFPVFEEDSETVSKIISTLGYELTPTMTGMFEAVFQAAKVFSSGDASDMEARTKWLSEFISNPSILRFGVKPDMWLISHMAEVAQIAIRDDDPDGKQKLHDWGWQGIRNCSKTDSRTFEGIKKRTRKAAAALHRMETISQQVAGDAEPLPLDRTSLVQYGTISIVALAGYTGDFQATIYSIVANEILEARVRGDLQLPLLLVLEEAHNFAPGKAKTYAEERAVATTREIAQEGRKFGVGMIVISQRPSNLDETTLSMCNSYVVMRMVNPADQSFIRRVIETMGEGEVNMLPDLDVGEAILSGQFINFPVLVRIKPPDSKGKHEEDDAFKALEKAHSMSGKVAK